MFGLVFLVIMNRLQLFRRVPVLPGFLTLAIANNLWAVSLPETDQRAQMVRTLNTPRSFPVIDSPEAWKERARQIRLQAQVSCGLWPMPEKTPLHERIFDRTEGEGYSVEKVVLQTYPGFYLSGNLYRPLERGEGPFPGVLNPHGHWSEGRLVDEDRGSVPARCIQFARMGMVAFAYDMVGYNDTTQVDHTFAQAPENQLWLISLMGLQTWNSIRALDFLESLPDVDSSRLACTGASGGGTQTFMLGAIDDRLALQAPTVMVSHSMQGGCLCENAPGLRVEYSNMEIAAAAAPRPQITVAASGDWTRETLSVEGPAILSVYSLLGADDRYTYDLFDFPHNYNRTTREKVYGWFARWLLNIPSSSPVEEQGYMKPANEFLRTFPGGELPPDALSESELIARLQSRFKEQRASYVPKRRQELSEYKSVFYPLWIHSLQLESPVRHLIVEEEEKSSPYPQYHSTRMALGREGRGDRISCFYFEPARENKSWTVVLVHPEGKKGWLDEDGIPQGLALRLLEHDYPIIAPDLFLTGESANPDLEAKRNPKDKFFTVYNRTLLQERVQDLVTVSGYVRRDKPGQKVLFLGTNRAGLWTLFAAPAADAVIADADATELSEQDFLAQDLFSPGLLRLGHVAGTAMLAAPNPLLIHNLGEIFPKQNFIQTYGAAAQRSALNLSDERVSTETLIRWMARMN